MTTIVAEKQTLNHIFESSLEKKSVLDKVSRKNTLDRIKELGLPTPKLEDWKYVDLESLLNLKLSTEIPLAKETIDVEGLKRNDVSQLVFYNGKLILNTVKSQAGLSLTLQSKLNEISSITQKYIKDANKDSNVFTSVNQLFNSDIVILKVEKNIQLSQAIHIVNIVDSSESSIHSPRLSIELDAGAKADVVVSTEIQNGMHFSNNLIQATVLDSAVLNLVVDSQADAGSSVVFDTTRISLGFESELHQSRFIRGNILSRFDSEVTFNAKLAKAHLNGIALLDKEAKSFTRTLVNHFAPECFSRQLFKNILGGTSVSEYSGAVKVIREAQLTDSGQSNNNLLLSSGARSLSRPQLRIHADDVKAAHGSNTGQLDEKEVFYLRSRGLTNVEARALLLYGFVEEVIQEVPIEFIREDLELLLTEDLKLFQE